MRHAWITILLALPLCGTACRSSGVADAIANARDTDFVIESKLELLDPRPVGVGSARALEFALRNTSSERLEFKYSVDWFDVGGRIVPLSSMAWHALGMDGRATSSVRVAPMPSEAVSWRLRFQSTEGR